MIEATFILMLLIALAIPFIGVLLVVSGFSDGDVIKTVIGGLIVWISYIITLKSIK